MIRMALLAIGFVAITVGLLVFQPGGGHRRADTPPVEPVVTRAEPALDTTDALLSALPSPPPMPTRTVATLPSSPLPTDDLLDDESMRRMTWTTLSNLNQVTGRDSAPGQPGSLLHTIVQRSLEEGAHSPQTPTTARVYVVQAGDSLVSIAERLYGDVNMTGPLFAANQGILARPDDLRPGQKLTLPE